MKKIFERAIVITLIISFAIGCWLQPIYAKTSVPKDLTKTTNQFLKTLRTNNFKKINTYINTWGQTDKVLFGGTIPNLKRVFENSAKKMSYTVKSIKVSNKKATVTVDFKIIDLQDFTWYMMGLIITDGDKIENMSEKEAAKYLNGIVKKASKNSDMKKYIKKQVKISFIKKGNKWKVEKVTEALANVMFSNYLNVVDSIPTSN